MAGDMDRDKSERPRQEKGDSEIYETPVSRFVVSSDAKRSAIVHPYEPGGTIANRYRVEREIGVGGMCTVYLVSEPNRSKQPIALKVVAGETNPVRLETFRNEFHILAHLNHENLIRVFDFGVLPGNDGFFYTAEYIEGSDLSEAATDAGEEKLIHYIVQACRALEYVHTRGYIHYDVKPKNLLVTRDGVVKLTDFGLSALAGRGLGKRVRGTPAYTAPEIITGADIDYRADLYSLGAALYEIATGTPPFRRRDLHDLFRAHLTEPPKPLRSIRPEVPEYLDSIVLRLLAKNPADRYDSANAVIEAISKARGVEIELQPESSAEGYLRMPPLRGRDSEMEAVRSALDKLADGRGGHVLIEGPKGIGCTRFLREIHFEAQLRGYATAFGKADEGNLFEKLATELTAHHKVEPPPATEGDNELQTADVSVTLPDTAASIVAAAEHVPVVMGVDDIHAAQPSTRAALESLGRILTTSDAPALLLVTAWHDTEGKEAIVTPSTIRLRLRSLSQEEVGEVATLMFGRVPAPELFVSRLAEATGGNPHAVVEMVRMLVASGEIAVIEGKWRFRGGIEPFAMPQSLAGFYSNQIETLGRFEHSLALNLALLGRAASMTEISTIHNEPAERVAAALGDLERHEIIRRADGRVEIANQGLRDALFASRTRVALMLRHKRIAEKLASISDRDVGDLEIAKHFLLGGSRRKGLRYGLSGIEAGEVEKDPAAVVPVLERLRTVSQKAARAVRAKVLFALAEAITDRSDPRATIEVIEEYLSVAPQKESAERRIRMQRHAAKCYDRLNRPEQAYAAWKRTLALAKPGSPDYLRILAAYSTALQYHGKFAECERLLLDAVERFGDKKDPGMLGLLINLAHLAMHQEKLDLVDEYSDRVYNLARQIGEDETPKVLSLLAMKNYVRDEYEEAETHLKRARQTALELKQFRLLGSITNNLTVIAFRLGHVDEALQYAAEVETIWRRYGNFRGLAHLHVALGNAISRRVGSTPALGYLRKGLEYARIAGTTMMEHELLDKIANVLFRRGDLEGAIQYSREADQLVMSGRMEQRVFPRLTRAIATALAGSAAAGLESATKALDMALEGTDASAVMNARQVLGLIAVMAGDFRLALGQLDCFEKLAPKSSIEERFEILMFSAEFWFGVGQFGRVSEILRRIADEPDMIESDLDRGRSAMMVGRLATSYYRFTEAEASFRTADHLHSADRHVGAFIELSQAKVELEFCKRDAEAARTQLERLKATVVALPSTSAFYSLLVQRLRARLALLEGDREAAYREAMSGLLEARGAGYRLLQLHFAKIAAETTRDADESENLSENAAELAAELAEPFDASIRESVREHLLAPPHESAPFIGDEFSADKAAGIAEDLVQLAIFLARENDPQRAIQAILDVAFRVLDAKRAFVVIREKDGLTFTGNRYASGVAPEAPDREVSTSIIERVIETGTTVFSERAKDETIFASFQSVIDLDLLSVLAVPLRIGGVVRGCLYLDNAGTAGAFSTEGRRLAECLAGLAGAVLDKQLLLQKTREASESIQYRFEQQSAEFEIVRQELEAEREARETEVGLRAIIGQSPAIRKVAAALERAATVSFPVLLTGESGTGKDLAAKVLHNIGPRRKARLIAVNCGSIPESLFEAELFGVERGAFTGAEETKPGLVEMAHGGTLLLDETADLPPSAQNSLLRAVSEGTIRRVGGREPIKVDIRIVSASNRNLARLVEDGHFRSDLFFRLNTIEIILPPLREREGDVPMLASHFLKDITEAHGGKMKPLSLAAMKRLEEYSWPGNVLELRNVLERAYLVAEEKITPDDFKLVSPQPEAIADAKLDPGKLRLEDLEREHILRVLNLNKGQIGKTARQLGINRHTLRNKLNRYNKEGYLS
ncbi:MAG: GAF domain-containing protein [Planctomycetota bacterium]|nr:MAG: GAF domain-containing protein [Planctomycetota bacterium]